MSLTCPRPRSQLPGPNKKERAGERQLPDPRMRPPPHCLGENDLPHAREYPRVVQEQTSAPDAAPTVFVPPIDAAVADVVAALLVALLDADADADEEAAS